MVDKNISKRLLIWLVLAIALGGFGATVASLSLASRATIPTTWTRDLEPVVIPGTTVSALVGVPIDELFVYAYRGNMWEQIPAQVDEITVTGVYTAMENGLLDSNDEIVFMAKDLGNLVLSATPISASLPVSPGWYEIEVTDPLSPTQKGWAYMVRSRALAPSVTADYVDFDLGFHRILAADYSLGFGVTHVGVDFLTLGDSAVEILDRSKIHLDCAIPVICPITDETISPVDDGLIKDGPVRIIARGGQVQAYGAMLRWASPFRIPTFLSGSGELRFSSDFNQAAIGATYYNAAVPGGVRVDGITDTVPAQPLSLWWQLSTDSGTVIRVADTSSVGGTQSNYYVDNAALDESDTGDRQHYGDTGIVVENPNARFTYSLTAYFLPDAHPNVGATFEGYSNHPLQTVTRLRDVPPRCDWSDQTYDDFYTPPDLGELTPERLGEVLRVEHIRSYTPGEVAAATNLPSSPYGAKAFRVLYLSQTPLDTPQAVSGMIIVPVGGPSDDAFPVVAAGHGTTGLADSCALSRYVPNVNWLLPWVAQGYMASATDYVGLGTPGPHPYAVGESEAYSLLDSARAALRFCDSSHGIHAPPAANRVILGGHSQGGHAALFAHQEWQSYAPDLNVLGTIAFAPGSEPRLLTQRIAEGSSLLTTPAAMAMYSYSEYYEDPTDLHTWLQEPYATEIATRVEQQCLAGLALWIGYDPERVFQSNLIAAVAEGRWHDLQPLTTYLDVNTPGDFTSDVPVLILQGENDAYIPPEISERLMLRLCSNGTPVAMSRYEGVGHSGILRAARQEAFQWSADRMAGVAAPDDCLNSHSVFLPLMLR